MKHYYTSVEVIGNSVAVRAIDENGDRVAYRDRTFKPEMFIPSNTPTNYESINGDPLELIQPGNIKETREWLKQYKHTNMDICGNEKFLYQYMGKNWDKDIEWSMDKLRILNLDLECECEHGFPDPSIAPEPILLITMEVKGSYITLGTKAYTGKQPGQRFKYIQCADESDLLMQFMSIWKRIDPDVVTGWNVNLFDMPYIINRIKKLFGEGEEKQLSPWRRVMEREVHNMNRVQMAYLISGVATLDYLDLYKKNTYSDRESYKLDHIAHVELGEKKLSHDEHANMHLFYKNDWNKYVEYNVQDVRLVRRLDDKLKLMELNITRAYDSRVNYVDIFSQVRTWDAIIYNWLRDQDVIIPVSKEVVDAGVFAGAFVADPKVGMHEWVMSFDLNSLYPHLIMQYNISPDTYVGKRTDVHVDSVLLGAVQADDPNCTLAANGAMYKKDKQGFLPQIMDKMYRDRSVAKRKMMDAKQRLEEDPDNKDIQFEIAKWNNKQMAAKIALNSAYGAFGSKYFRFYDTIHATAITLSGQLAIRWIGDKLNAYFQKALETDDNYIIASDTDSVYLACSGIVNKIKPKDPVEFLDTFSKTVLTPFIGRCYQELADKMNAYEQKMIMEREVIADKGVWVKKKRYILNVHDNEGVRYKKPKLKIMGIETQKSSTPAICRGALLKAFDLMINEDIAAVKAFCEEFEKEFLKAPPEEVASPRGVKGLTKFHDPLRIYRKSTPLHVKGSLIYNRMLKEMDLDKHYPIISEGEKIKYAYLNMPNPAKDTVISFPGILPDEFDLDRFIDRDKQFEKAFLDPLDAVLTAIDWSRKDTLESLFG
jgi:DNA polymerase elongation subunit (family B)